MKKLVIISRSPEKAHPDYKGHAFYEYFYEHMADGFNVTVLSSAVEKKKEEKGITYYPWKEQTGIKGAKGLISALGEIKPDIILSENSSLSAITAFSIGKLYGSTTVLRLAGIPSSNYKNLLSNILADKKIAVSETIGNHLYGDYRVIYPGTEFPRNVQKKEKNEEKQVIGYLGRFHKDKGTDRLVELAEEILPSDNIRFKVAGYGKFRKEEIEKLDLEYENFEYIGKIPNKEVFAFLSSLDALFMPSRSEGMPRTPIESMYVGTPVIAWDISPHKEIIEDNDLIISNIAEATKLIKDRNIPKGLDWFNYEEFEVKQEMNDLKQLLND